MELLTNLTLFGSFIWFAISIVALFIAFLISDITEEGYGATISFSAFIGLQFFWGNLPFAEVFFWKNVLMYLFLGLVFAILRTYFKGKELTREYEERSTKYEFDSLEKFKKEFDLKSSVFRWWFLFPVSLLTWLCGTLMKDSWNALYAKVGTMFYKILNA